MVGADVSPGMLRRASARNAGAAAGNVGLVRLDLNAPLPFRNVGQVMLVHSLQVVRDPGLVLRRVHGILAPGARLLVVAKKAPGRPRRTRRRLVRRLKQLAAVTGWSRSFPGIRP